MNMQVRQFVQPFLLGAFILFAPSADCLARTQSKKIVNCLTPSVQKRRFKLCSNVIDPIKFKKGDKENIDCTKPLQDGYDAGICQKVNEKEQRKFHKLARAGNL